ncbi:MAG: hypothetical protein AAFX99_25650 [Myxococcota bacterium]
MKHHFIVCVTAAALALVGACNTSQPDSGTTGAATSSGAATPSSGAATTTAPATPKDKAGETTAAKTETSATETTPAKDEAKDKGAGLLPEPNFNLETGGDLKPPSSGGLLGGADEGDSKPRLLDTELKPGP